LVSVHWPRRERGEQRPVEQADVVGRDDVLPATADLLTASTGRRTGGK
jgi:hypothetical protein